MPFAVVEYPRTLTLKDSASMTIYCVYLTLYRGNKLPPFYIGSTSLDKIARGYRGSVSSKEYKHIWKQEVKENPHLFKTYSLSKHENRKEALEREEQFQRSLKVVGNPLYINKSYATTGCFGPTRLGLKHTEETKLKIKTSLSGRKRTKEQCDRIGNAKRGIIQSEESNRKRSIAQKGKPKPPKTLEQRHQQSLRQMGKSQSKESNIRRSETLRKSFYFTPIGMFDSLYFLEAQAQTIQKWCRFPDIIITHNSYMRSKFLQEHFEWLEIQGKTFRDLGFYKISKP